MPNIKKHILHCFVLKIGPELCFTLFCIAEYFTHTFPKARETFLYSLVQGKHSHKIQERQACRTLQELAGISCRDTLHCSAVLLCTHAHLDRTEQSRTLTYDFLKTPHPHIKIITHSIVILTACVGTAEYDQYIDSFIFNPGVALSF